MGRRSSLLLLSVVVVLSACAVPGQRSEERGGFFRVEQRSGVWWLITPEGKPFFSLGVNVVDRGASRERYGPDRPQYAAFRHYANDASWARTTLSRLRNWGFNTLGGWCDIDTLNRESDLKLPYTVGLWMGSGAGVPWLDLFSKETERKFDEAARRVVEPRKDDPLLIGYYSDNELGWWDETIFQYHLEHRGTETRRALIKLLHAQYGNSFRRLRRDFIAVKATTFYELDRLGSLILRPGGRGHEVIDRFTFLLAQRYYKLAHDSIRRYDKNHLILGDRYIAWYPLAVARAIGPYVDVVSTNYQADWTDGSNARFYFDTLHRLTGKPILVTEYYFCAMQNRSGNKNTGAGFPTVRTQDERAGAFRKNLAAYASLPYVVGAHWFQYYDEPTHGRADGEDFNMGFVDIEDRPYKGLVEAASAVGANVPQIHAHSPDAVLDSYPPVGGTRIPRVAGTAEAGLRDWNKPLAFIADHGEPGCADLYACWSPTNLYIAVHMADYVDEKLYPHGRLPQTERPEWIVTSGRKSIRVRFGPGGPATVKGAHARGRQWTGRVRYTALLTVPASSLGMTAFQSGDRVPLRSALTAHCRSRRMNWSTTLQLTNAN